VNRPYSVISITASFLFFLFISDAKATDVEVRVLGLQPEQGNVIAGLYLNQAAFESERFTDWRAAPVTEHSETKLLFTDLDPGIYGIAVYQDLNANEVLDKTSLGVPTEPYGFSKNIRNRFRPPDFSDFSFELGNEPFALEIQLE
tara:strand:- start:430 stop:864 length:435 start_codon:yes stop_codon:yes gene_type:complete